MTLKNKPYQDACHRELIRWPGASVEFSVGGVHLIATLSFDGRTRRVFFPGTPGDSRRGQLNFMTDIKAELRALGAKMRLPHAESKRQSVARKMAPKRRPKAAKRPPKPDPTIRPDNWLRPLKLILEDIKTND